MNRFKNSQDWNHQLPNEKKAKIIIGEFLTGNTLLDNSRIKGELLKDFPEAKGLEMEGSGLYSAAVNKRTDWILVKGISDWGDGKKSENKLKNQKIAIESVISLCKHVLNSGSVFKGLDCFEFPKNNNRGMKNINLNKDPLFISYKKEFEEYYLKRCVDEEISQILDSYSIWLSGPTGSGKTVILQRQGIIKNKDYIYLSLDHCVNCCEKEIFYNVFSDLTIHFKENFNSSIEKTPPQLIQGIASLIERKINNKPLYIHIDEVPIEDHQVFLEFVKILYGLIQKIQTKLPSNNIKFAISTIDEPKSVFNPTSKAICESIKFYNCKYWEKEELEKLLDILIKAIPVNLNSKQKTLIVEEANITPRFIKVFIRNYLFRQGLPNFSFEKLILETKENIL